MSSNAATARIDREGFSAFYARFHPRLVAFCRTRTSDGAIAEDAAQETFVRALVRFDMLDPHGVWPWMKVVASHVVVDHMRKTGREIPLDVLEGRGILDGIGEAEGRMDIEQALTRLPRRQRSAVELRYLRDHDPIEVARLLGVNVFAVKQLLYRARNGLRAEFRRAARDVSAIAWIPVLLVRRLRRATAIRTRRWFSRARTAMRTASNAVQFLTILTCSFAFVSLPGAGPASAAPGAGPVRSLPAVAPASPSFVHTSVFSATEAFERTAAVPVRGAHGRRGPGRTRTSSCSRSDVRVSATGSGFLPDLALDVPGRAVGRFCSMARGVGRMRTLRLLRDVLADLEDLGRTVGTASTAIARSVGGLSSAGRAAVAMLGLGRAGPPRLAIADSATEPDLI